MAKNNLGSWNDMTIWIDNMWNTSIYYVFNYFSLILHLPNLKICWISGNLSNQARHYNFVESITLITHSYLRCVALVSCSLVTPNHRKLHKVISSFESFRQMYKVRLMSIGFRRSPIRVSWLLEILTEWDELRQSDGLRLSLGSLGWFAPLSEFHVYLGDSKPGFQNFDENSIRIIAVF